MSSLRIGLLTDVFFPDQNGVSTSVLLLQRELRRRGHQAVIMAPRFPGHRDSSEYQGVLRMPSVVNPALPRQRLAFPTRRRLPGRFDLIHTHTPGSIGWWGSRLARRWDVPHVSTFHTHLERYTHYIPGLTQLERHAGFVTRVVRRFYSTADLIVAPSEGSQSMLHDYGILRPSVVLPTGIDEALLAAAPDQPSPWPAGTRRLLSVGRLGHEKRMDLVLNALAALREQHDAHLVVLGEGPQEAALRTHADTLGLRDHVTFLGPVPFSDIGAYYRMAELFMFGSDSETQGLVLIEAQTMGLPVVAVGAQGTLNGVQHQVSGYLVSPGDWAALADHAATLLAHPEQHAAFRREAHTFAAQFSAAQMAEQMLDLYSYALSAARPRVAWDSVAGTPLTLQAARNLEPSVHAAQNSRKYGLRGF
ncbi:glycosyltransferase [Deinococcus sonorensis]|uniref:Glycosyltransferase n=2 Tax=Deinococcus sonorensis TaxID=309891 RepID=A0AAU7UCC0_9DEIO